MVDIMDNNKERVGESERPHLLFWRSRSSTSKLKKRKKNRKPINKDTMTILLGVLCIVGGVGFFYLLGLGVNPHISNVTTTIPVVTTIQFNPLGSKLNPFPPAWYGVGWYNLTNKKCGGAGVMYVDNLQTIQNYTTCVYKVNIPTTITINVTNTIANPEWPLGTRQNPYPNSWYGAGWYNYTNSSCGNVGAVYIENYSTWVAGYSYCT
jgi:hypothetical protein